MDVQVLIADDHMAIIMIASELAKKAFDNPTVRVAKGADELFEELDRQPVDLLVLDLTMPGAVKRIELLRALRTWSAPPRILVYSADAAPCLVAAALESGARGFVPKGAPLASLLDGMKAVAKGERYVDTSIEGAGGTHPWRLLTAAEREVLTALVAGRTLKQIALDSGRAYNTAATLRSNGMNKLGLRATEELAGFFERHGLFFELDEPFSPVSNAPARPASSFPDNVVELRPGNLSAVDIETIDVIALMLLGVEDGSKLMEVTTQPREELLDGYGSPPASVSRAFRFPAWRWAQGGAQWLLIDQGRVRITINAAVAARQLS